ncbi:MAG: hypothetical protein L6Q71_12855, partial [Planctomycetes bacterium]|nr:hypothetical protein [Planctomycetota bacterium]
TAPETPVVEIEGVPPPPQPEQPKPPAGDGKVPSLDFGEEPGDIPVIDIDGERLPQPAAREDDGSRLLDLLKGIGKTPDDRLTFNKAARIGSEEAEWWTRRYKQLLSLLNPGY